MQLAAIAPTAMASSVALASGEASSLVNAAVGLSEVAGPMVTEAAPTISRTAQDRNNPSDGEQPGSGGRHRGGQVAGVVGGVRGPARGVAERGADGQQEPAQAADAVGNGRRAQVRLAEDHHRGDCEDDREQREDQRSKACTRLWPKNANTVWISTMIISASSGPMWNRVESANAPLTLLVANQPTPAVTDISTAGTGVALEPECQAPQHHLWHPV